MQGRKVEYYAMTFFALLFVLFLRINIALETQYVKKTGTAVLKCHTLQVQYSFIWLRLDTQKVYATDSGINQNLTLALTNKIRLRDRFDLEIHNVSENDIGTYRCNSRENATDIHLQIEEPQKNLTVLQVIPKLSMIVSPSQTVIEGQALTITCVLETIYTSATIVWVHNNETIMGASVTREADMKSCHSEHIVFRKVKRVDAGYYQCIANNSAGLHEAQKALKEIVVQYAPNVVINETESTTENTILICEANGIPSKYTFEPWEHLTESRQRIRYVTGFRDGSRNILLLNKSVQIGSYQDSGIYVCRVSNAVQDVNGQLLQNDSITLPYTGKPVFLSTTGKSQHGQLGESVSLEADVFSDTNQSSLHSYWNVSNKLINCTRYKQSCSQLKLKTSFHDALVEVTGYRCSLAIQNIQESDYQVYTITVSNTFGNCSLNIKLALTNNEGSFKAVYITITVMSVTVVVILLLTCWQRINATKRRKDALNYTVNEEVVTGVAENSLYQLGALPRSSDQYSSIDRRSQIDGRLDSEVLVHTVAQNSGNHLGVVTVVHSYDLSSSSDEYSSIDRRSQTDGGFNSDDFDSGERFIHPRAVLNFSENINLVLNEGQESTRLHYAEVSFEDVETRPRHNEPCMRELVSSTQYAEVEHTVKPNPLPESGSDVSSEEDFVYVRNIQQWRQELFK